MPDLGPPKQVCSGGSYGAEDQLAPIFDERWREEYVKKMGSIGRRPPAVPLADIEAHLVLGALNGISSVATARDKAHSPRSTPRPTSTNRASL